MADLGVLCLRYITNCFDGFFLTLIAMALFNIKPKRTSILFSALSIALLFFIGGMLYLYTENFYINIAMNAYNILLPAIVLGVFLRIHYFKSVFACALYMIVSMFFNEGIMILLTVHLKLDVHAMMRNGLIVIAFNLLAYIVNILLILIIKFVRKRIVKLEIKNRIYLIFIISTLFVLALNLEVIRFFLKNEFTIIAFLLIATILGGYLIINIFLARNFLNMNKKEQELKHQKFYNEALSRLMDDVRAYKHGYDNMFQTINGYVKMKKWDDLSSYMSSFERQQKQIDISENIVYNKIKNAGLAGLIISKISKIDELGIELKLIISTEIDTVSCNVSDLCEIVGIILDNAIEAASEASEKSIKMMITNNEGSVEIQIDNSSDKKVDLSKVYDKGWSTKGEGRGLGLWILIKTIKKYKNVSFSIQEQGNYIRQELVIN